MRAPSELSIYETYRTTISDMFISEKVNEAIEIELKEVAKNSFFSRIRDESHFRSKLKRVLVAVSFCEELGFSQGWGVIAANLLRHGEEEFVYYCFTSMLRALEASKIYSTPASSFQKMSEDFFFDFAYEGCEKVRESLKLRSVFPAIVFKPFFQSWGFACVPNKYDLTLAQGLWTKGWDFLRELLGAIMAKLVPFCVQLNVEEIQALFQRLQEGSANAFLDFDPNWQEIFNGLSK